MLIVEHRKNTIEELKLVPPDHGVEIDIRSDGNKLILHHEPFSEGTEFGEWLKYFNHRFIILNVKEEGIEGRIQELIYKRGIKDYFFLDVSFPFMVWLSNEGMREFAVRLSEFESLETVLNMKGRVKYVWVDCFTKLPLNRDIYRKLKTAELKICIVSPELQKHDIKEIETYAEALWKEGIYFDAVCTKKPQLWHDLIIKHL